MRVAAAHLVQYVVAVNNPQGVLTAHRGGASVWLAKSLRAPARHLCCASPAGSVCAIGLPGAFSAMVSNLKENANEIASCSFAACCTCDRFGRDDCFDRRSSACR